MWVCIRRAKIMPLMYGTKLLCKCIPKLNLDIDKLCENLFKNLSAKPKSMMT